jgi:hypothetical protein
MFGQVHIHTHTHTYMYKTHENQLFCMCGVSNISRTWSHWQNGNIAPGSHDGDDAQLYFFRCTSPLGRIRPRTWVVFSSLSSSSYFIGYQEGLYCIRVFAYLEIYYVICMYDSKTRAYDVRLICGIRVTSGSRRIVIARSVQPSGRLQSSYDPLPTRFTADLARYVRAWNTVPPERGATTLTGYSGMEIYQ